jgi:tetratricopeptide (TPR) repeat protein
MEWGEMGSSTLSPRGIGRAGQLRALPAALLVGAIAAVFGRIVGHGFLSWDDLVNTVENPHIHPPSLAGTAFFWGHAYMDLYIPATYTTWALLARVALEPWLFHCASLAIHAGSALAAFALLRRLVRDERAACAGAVLFALHPVQVEAVGWMSGMKDLLCGLFALLALRQYVEFAAAGRGGPGRPRHFARASLFYLLALLSKPAAVAVPLLAGVLDVAMLARRPRQVVRDLLPWTALAVAWILVTRAVQPAADVASVSLSARPLVACDALAFYLGKLVLPLHLAPDYGRGPEWLLEHGSPFVTALVPIVLAAGLLLSLKRAGAGPGARAAAAGAGLFAAGVAPVLGLVPFDFQRYSTVADHYLYLSMLGPALLLAWLLSERGGRAVWAVSALALAILAARSAAQVGVWKDDLTLYRHTLEVNPRSWVSHDNLGQALQERGLAREAIAEFEAALSINPRDARTHFNLGTALDALDRTAEAIPHLEEAVRLRPEDRMAQENLGIAHLRIGHPEEAEVHLRAALAIRPDSWLAHYYLAGALDRLGRIDEMLAHLREAVRINPRFGPARRDLESVLRARGQGGGR